MSYFLITEESSTISLESIHDKIKTGVQKLFGENNVNVVIKNQGVFWILSKEVTFIVRISDAETIAMEADDLAEFTSDLDARLRISKAKIRFVCHNHDRNGTNSEEFNYFLSILRGDYQGWCFCLESRRYVDISYDEKILFRKERFITGLSALTSSKRMKVTRMFSEPIPQHVSSEEEFLLKVNAIPPDIVEKLCKALPIWGYEEVKKSNDGREFLYIKNKAWGLRVNVTPNEIYFSVSGSNYYSGGALFEAYQSGAEIVGDEPLRVYDAKRDEWICYL